MDQTTQARAPQPADVPSARTLAIASAVALALAVATTLGVMYLTRPHTRGPRGRPAAPGRELVSGDIGADPLLWCRDPRSAT